MFKSNDQIRQRWSASSSALATDTAAVPWTLATAIFSAFDCDNFARRLSSASETPFAGWIMTRPPARVAHPPALRRKPAVETASSYELLAETNNLAAYALSRTNAFAKAGDQSNDGTAAMSEIRVCLASGCVTRIAKTTILEEKRNVVQARLAVFKRGTIAGRYHDKDPRQRGTRFFNRFRRSSP